MGKFQRYSFWIIGWLLMVTAIMQFISSALFMKRSFKGLQDLSFLDILSFIPNTFGYPFFWVAVGLICMFLARICKLEEDPAFKQALDQTVSTLRTKTGKED